MTVVVDIKIHNRLVGQALISNRGHPSDGKHPDHDGLREYSYDVFDQDGRVLRKGTVIHLRERGAVELVRRVFDDLPEMSR